MNEARIVRYKESHVIWFPLYETFRTDKFIETESTLLH